MELFNVNLVRVEDVFAYVLNNPGVEIFPELVRAEDARLLQMRAVYLFNTRPPHELRCCETLHQRTTTNHQSPVVMKT